ncbi:hypothetical protein FRC01_001182 [Tulasnella sp. 417]|nr:hypothetical protein FRC01_001182 [Tulasnella sp. 417]
MEVKDYREYSSDSNTTKSVAIEVSGELLLAGIPRYRIDKNRLEFREVEPMARGGQAVVHQAVLVSTEGGDAEKGHKVAVKKFHMDSETDHKKFLDDFAREIIFMIAASHPNIINFIGFVEDIENGDVWMVLPWQANGNVREFLQSGEWYIPERISLIKDIVFGLEYLHTRWIPICHGDLKSFNILVNSDLRAVITDFGSARAKRKLEERGESGSEAGTSGRANASDFSEAPKAMFDVSTMEITMTGPKYTLRWAAPEVLSGNNPDLPSDIWALGWICWEVVTGQLPFSDAETISEIVVKAMLGMLPEARDHPQLNHIISLCNLMSDCWALDPTARPDASACLVQIRLMPLTVPSPCNPHGPKVETPALLAGIGYMHRLQRDWAKAESHYRAGLEAANLTDDHEAQANAWNLLGDVYAAQLKNIEAEDSYLRSQQIYSRIGHENGVADTWHGLALVYGHQSRIREAEEAFIKAEKICSRIGNNMGRADACSGMGELFRRQGEYEKAEKSHGKALEIHTKLGNNLGISASLIALGSVYIIIRKYEEAENAFLWGQKIGYRAGDDLAAGTASSGLAALYQIQFRYDDAEKAFIEAKRALTRIGRDAGLGATLNGLGSVYRAQGKYAEAMETFLESEKLHKDVSNDVDIANSLLGQARVRLVQGAFAEAEELFHRGKAIHARAGNKDGIVSALVGLGELHQNQGNRAEAEIFLDQVQAMCKVIGDETGRARALLNLADARLKQSKFKEAEESLDEARTISSRIDTPHDRAWILRRLGQMYQRQSRNLDAEVCYKRAEEGYGSAGDDQRRAEVLLFLSGLYLTQARHLEAKESFRRTLTLFTQVGHVTGQLHALDGLIWVGCAEQNVEDLVGSCREAEAICARAGLPLSETCRKISEALLEDDIQPSTSNGPVEHA